MVQGLVRQSSGIADRMDRRALIANGTLGIRDREHHADLLRRIGKLLGQYVRIG